MPDPSIEDAIAELADALAAHREWHYANDGQLASIPEGIEAARRQPEERACICPTFDGEQARSIFCPIPEHVVQALGLQPMEPAPAPPVRRMRDRGQA